MKALFSVKYSLVCWIYFMHISTCFAQDLQLTQHQDVRPILIGKSDNIILSIHIELPKLPTQLNLTSIYLSSSGTTDLDDIRSVKIYYTGDSAQFFKGQGFDITRNPNEGLIFEGQTKLNAGNNVFWVTVELENYCSLDHRIRLECIAIQLSDGSLHYPQSSSPITSSRVGHALRQRGQDGVHTYRIPGLATTNTGTLIAVYDTRRNSSVDLQGDIDVGMNRSTDGGQTWEPMKLIMDMGNWGGKGEAENGIGDPSILVDRSNNTIWVAAVWAHGHPGERNWYASKPGMQPQETSQFVLVKSIDDGKTWSEPINITSQIKAPQWHLLLQGPGKGITLADGTLVFPAQFKDHEQMPHSTLIYSKDHGETWHIGTGAKSNTTESQVVQLSDESLMLNMRDNRGRENPHGGARSVAITHDLGKTWTEHPSSAKALPEPVCMASLIQTTYQDNSMLLFSNPAVAKGPRRRMTLKVSLDEGMTWPESYHLLLNQDPAYGYSCLTQINEEYVGILYEGAGEIYFQRVAFRELLGK